jgi:hypothetical protein
MPQGKLSLCATRLVLLLSLLVAPLLSCSSAPHVDEDGTWSEVVVQNAPPQRDLLSAAEQAVMRTGFPPGERDEARGNVISGWDINLQPFRNQGRRWRGIIKVEVVEDGTRLAARVQTQKNVEMDDTLDAGAAEWEDEPDDRGRSRVLLQQFLSQLHLTGEDI